MSETRALLLRLIQILLIIGSYDTTHNTPLLVAIEQVRWRAYPTVAAGTDRLGGNRQRVIQGRVLGGRKKSSHERFLYNIYKERRVLQVLLSPSSIPADDRTNKDDCPAM